MHNPAYHVAGAFFTFHDKMVISDSKTGNKICMMKKKLFSHQFLLNCVGTGGASSMHCYYLGFPRCSTPGARQERKPGKRAPALLARLALANLSSSRWVPRYEVYVYTPAFEGQESTDTDDDTPVYLFAAIKAPHSCAPFGLPQKFNYELFSSSNEESVPTWTGPLPLLLHPPSRPPSPPPHLSPL
jgi:hypothetical protein